MKNLQLCSLFLCLTLQIFAQEKPSREVTIEYINKILKRTKDLEVRFKTSSSKPYGGDLNYLTYDPQNKTYTYSWNDYENYGNENCRFWFRKEYTNFTFKNVTSFEESWNNENKTATSPILYLAIKYLQKEITVRHGCDWEKNSCHCERTWDGKSSAAAIEIQYPTGDPDDRKRLINAFLRLKELDAELKDPFLD